MDANKQTGAEKPLRLLHPAGEIRRFHEILMLDKMKTILLHWIIAIIITVAMFAIGHFLEMEYLKAQYPSVYKYENTPPSKLEHVYDASTGQFKAIPNDENYDPQAHERYAEERNFLTFGIMLVSAILAVGALHSAATQKERKA